MSIHVRAARGADARVVRELLLHLASGFRIPADEAEYLSVFAAQLSDPAVDVFVAETTGPAGEPAQVTGVLSQRYFSTLNLGAAQAYIVELVVHPLARRRGVARALLAEAAEAARLRGARLIEVKTHPRRTAARALYESVGMVETCLVLERALSENAKLVVADDDAPERKEVVA